ncbi:MAG: L,D-transpeptidase [Ignavibacteria bacterium]|nr:L,D-transpeptidase [Ignavibacteria bacterium]MBT8382977.1 L,D-transpeptidase [Ignavibacteria bacterium]MBT8392303.1 L,D-transpeptidase [Ignavibacteria bacterium]NNJ52463.1 L,D-transpeptidase [Ignavibacteriaceae bacterium]NNL22357.1 L,D-transpeptidase [Ignavibacteriaceae bacterium]
MKDHFIEVNLLTQHATLYSRDGSKLVFPVSSGNKNIEEGIETRNGLFVIKSKAKKLYSVQFDSTVMLYWMGFNAGIGFHALLGKRYYGYLGKKNVSHGCIRVSREDAEFVYKQIEKGTPVLVHKGNSAVKIGFGRLGEVYKYYSYSENYRFIPQRYELIYTGDYLISAKDKILIDEENVGHNGLPIGNSEMIPVKQKIKPSTLWVDASLSEEKRLTEIFLGTETYALTYNPHLDSKN